MIGVAFITCNRQEYLKQSMESFKRFLTNGSVVITINDGRHLKGGVDYGKLIEHKKNRGVGQSKNDAFKFLRDAGCDHIFIIEDDIIASTTDVNPFEMYIKTAEETGLQHMMYGYHGPANKGGVSKGKPSPRLTVQYNDTISVALNPHCVGAFCYYSKACLDKVGVFDTKYLNAFEHVDHSYMIALAEMIPAYWWWPDVANSYEFLDEIACSEDSSSIRPRKDWQNNIREGAMYFKQKHGYLPAWDGCVPDTSESNILSLLKQIKQKYGS